MSLQNDYNKKAELCSCHLTCSEIRCAASFGSWHWLMASQISWLFMMKLTPSVVRARNESCTWCNCNACTSTHKNRDILYITSKQIKAQNSSSHRNPLCFGFRDDSCAFKVEIADAARHGQPPVDVWLTQTVPRNKPSTFAYPSETNITIRQIDLPWCVPWASPI